jgi:hypothetical protein
MWLKDVLDAKAIDSLPNMHNYFHKINNSLSAMSTGIPWLVMGIGNIFKIDDRYINIDRWSMTIAC